MSDFLTVIGFGGVGLILIFTIVFFIVSIKLKKVLKEYLLVKDRLTDIVTSIEQGEAEVVALRDRLSSLRDQIRSQVQEQEVILEKTLLIKENVEKEYELERVKRVSDFNAQLEKEFIELKQASPKEKYLEELAALSAQIQSEKEKLEAHQNSVQDRLKEDDFNNYHSINLSDADIADINLIRELMQRLNRQEAFKKLIWTEFIQKPIQQLCKTLNADRTRGIYKITEKETGRMYVGQAVDIGKRWKDHCKLALGIGSSSYLTNKLYKNMHEKGIHSFTFEILEAGEDINLNEKEFAFIDFYNATTFGFNSKAGV